MGLSTNRCRPNLEILEDRCCPTASVFAQDHTLYITTDPASDIVQILDNGHGGVSVSVRDRDGAFRTSASGIDQIVMHLRGGRDWIAIESPAPLEHNLALKIDMGPGNADKVYLNFAKGLGSSSLDVDLRGALGHSTIDTIVGPVGHGRFDFQQHLADSHVPSHVHFRNDPTPQERIYIG